MTDFSKYKNITVDNDTYATITKLQTKLAQDVKLSRSQVVKTLVNEKARKLNGRVSKQFYSIECLTTPEEKLWRAVLSQGVYEACSEKHKLCH